jgi:hypothetical protein
MPFDSALLRPDSLSTQDDGVSLAVRLPWMRSLPWTSVHRIEIQMGRESVPAERLRLMIGGQAVALDDLQGDEANGFWVVGRPLEVFIPLQAPARVGDVVNVSIAVEVTIPYLVSPSGEPVRLPFSASAALRAG